MKDTPLGYIELSQKNLIHNIKSFRGIAHQDTKIAAVIKANAYGHGQNEIAKILEPYVDYFQVDGVEELELLRKVTKKKVFLFGYVQKSDLLVAIKLGCVLTVFSIKELEEINKITGKLKIKQEVHIPIDARFGREGFLLADLPDFLKKAKTCKYIKISGIYAHFANLDEPTGFIHANKQIEAYQDAVETAKRLGFENLQTHISATSGILAYENSAQKKEAVNSIIRLGKGVYGVWPSDHLKSLYKNSKFTLKPVLTWKTKVAQIKNLPKDYTIGYGLSFKTKKETKVALIPQGYADGIDRGFSNIGEVLIQGTRCKILGRISMNMCVVNVSHLKNVQFEDEVVILGKQGKEEISAKELADKIGTITYEITTKISPLLPRIIKP